MEFPFVRCPGCNEPLDAEHAHWMVFWEDATKRDPDHVVDFLKWFQVCSECCVAMTDEQNEERRSAIYLEVARVVRDALKMDVVLYEWRIGKKMFDEDVYIPVDCRAFQPTQSVARKDGAS
jgi:hypothetical protein